MKASDGRPGAAPGRGRRCAKSSRKPKTCWLDTYAEVVRTQRAERFVDYNKGLDRWYYIYVFPATAPKERMQLGALFSDDTEKKRAEEALHESEERLRGAISIGTVGVMFWRKDYRLSDVNDAFLRMNGFSREEVLGKSWEEFTPQEFHEISRRRLEELVTRGEIAPFEKEYYRKDGTRWWGLFAPTRLSGSGPESECVEFVIDITEAKRAQEALRESEERLRRLNEQLEERVRERTRELAEANTSLEAEVSERRAAEERVRNLLQQLVSVQEGERRRIARELHDTLGQQLAALRLSIALLKSQADCGGKLHEQADRMQNIFDRLNSDVDFLAWELRPASLDQLGLDAALQTFVRKWGDHFKVEADYQSPGLEAPRLPPEVETNLYRIVQEALQNVHKHAGATHVNVLLDRRDGQAMLVLNRINEQIRIITAALKHPVGEETPEAAQQTPVTFRHLAHSSGDAQRDLIHRARAAAEQSRRLKQEAEMLQAFSKDIIEELFIRGAG